MIENQDVDRYCVLYFIWEVIDNEFKTELITSSIIININKDGELAYVLAK